MALTSFSMPVFPLAHSASRGFLPPRIPPVADSTRQGFLPASVSLRTLVCYVEIDCWISVAPRDVAKGYAGAYVKEVCYVLPVTAVRQSQPEM
jgi:hypothetical protein